MATAKKRGNSYRIRILDYTDANGVKHYKSFTAPTKKEVEYLAAEYQCKRKDIHTTDKSLNDALEEYIDMCAPLKSPSTIKAYKSMHKTLIDEYPDIMYMRLDKITKQILQKLVTRMCESKVYESRSKTASKNKTISNKTVINRMTLIQSALRENNIEYRLSLPKKEKKHKTMPSNEDIKTLLNAVKDTELEIPILLGAFGPMRRGEICALDSAHINGNSVYIENNVVMNDENELITKSPKTNAGYRVIIFPSFVADKLKDIDGKVTPLSPDDITRKFRRLIRRLDIPTFRFHDLRHYSASMLHAMGVPDLYIMQRGGWSDYSTLKNIYQHTLENEEKKMYDLANTKFEKIFK